MNAHHRIHAVARFTSHRKHSWAARVDEEERWILADVIELTDRRSLERCAFPAQQRTNPHRRLSHRRDRRSLQSYSRRGLITAAHRDPDPAWVQLGQRVRVGGKHCRMPRHRVRHRWEQRYCSRLVGDFSQPQIHVVSGSLVVMDPHAIDARVLGPDSEVMGPRQRHVSVVVHFDTQCHWPSSLALVLGAGQPIGELRGLLARSGQSPRD